jgi:hypothetical protein
MKLLHEFGNFHFFGHRTAPFHSRFIVTKIGDERNGTWTNKSPGRRPGD